MTFVISVVLQTILVVTFWIEPKTCEEKPDIKIHNEVLEKHNIASKSPKWQSFNFTTHGWAIMKEIKNTLPDDHDPPSTHVSVLMENKLNAGSKINFKINTGSPERLNTHSGYVQMKMLPVSTRAEEAPYNRQKGIFVTTNKPQVYLDSDWLSTRAFLPQPKSNHLLGPLHGPDWLLNSGKMPKKRPLDTATGVEGTFLWAVGLFGTIENGAIVFTAMFSKRFKKPLHMLVGTLAVTDLFVSVIYIPSYTYFLLEGEKPEEKQTDSIWNFCTISRMVFIEIASVTLTIKVLISLYLNILSYSKTLAETIFDTKNTIVYIVMAWIANFGLLFIPNFLGLRHVDFYPNGVICIQDSGMKPDERATWIYTIITLCIHLMELLIICICFIKVYVAIQTGKHISQMQNKVPDKRCDIFYQRAMKITVLFFINFTLCWLPIYVVNLIDPSHLRLPALIHHFAMDLLLLKSAINPAIYIYGVRSLRREMKVVCMCRCNSVGKNGKLAIYRTSLDSTNTSNTTKCGQMI